MMQMASVGGKHTWAASLQAILQKPFFRHILHPRQIPLLYSVVVMTSIFYHYGSEYTPLWFFAAAVIQWALFRLMDFVNQHHLLGGALYVVTGILTLILAQGCITVGGDHSMFGGMFAPVGTDINISFMVWFLTPQSVLNAFYGPYTVALFLLFSFFIATITYYYSHVRHRIFMSFIIMCFPFTIYAKESETMPVPFIVALFVLYFVVMILCRQFHGGDETLMRPHETQVTGYALAEPESLTKLQGKALLEAPRPEVFGSRIWSASALFLGAACVLVLILPKPNVIADRGQLDSLLDMSAFTDYLLNSISAFSEESDGGSYSSLSSSQPLYYAAAEETMNLRLSTYTYYDYETDSWSAERMDRSDAYASYKSPQSLLADTDAASGYSEYLTDHWGMTPYDYYVFFSLVAEEFPELAEEYGFSDITNILLNPSAYVKELALSAATYNGMGYMAPLHTVSIGSQTPDVQIYQSENGVFFRTNPAIIRRESFQMQYVSATIVSTEAMQYLLQQVENVELGALLFELYVSYEPSEALSAVMSRANWDRYDAQLYASYTDEESRPEDVSALAASLTEGLTTDYEKARAICDYLRMNHTYDMDAIIGEDDNVQTFLFENQTGVCYQFASAMTQLCRAAGLTARYVEGYALAEPGRYSSAPGVNYVIRAKHAHAFTEVYLAGYGWMSFDATAADNTAGTVDLSGAEDIVDTLQRTGLILLAISSIVVLILYWLLPLLREWLFRRKYCRHMDANVMMRAYVRLKKQWQMSDTATIREVCAQVSDVFAWDAEAEAALPLLQTALETVVYGECYTRDLAVQCYRAYCTLQKAYPKCRKQQLRDEKQAAAQRNVQQEG